MAQFKTAQIVGLQADVERQPAYSSRGVVGTLGGYGSCETRVRGTLADVLRLMGHLGQFPGAEHEWCNVTLTIEADEAAIWGFSRRAHEMLHGKPALHDGSRADGKDG